MSNTVECSILAGTEAQLDHLFRYEPDEKSLVFNLHASLTAADDTLPRRMTEPVPGGPRAGSFARLHENLQTYYRSDHQERLSAGDEIALFPPMAGGVELC